MGRTKYFINLNPEEIEALKAVAENSENTKIQRTRAEILLCLDGRKPDYTIVDHLAFTYGVSKSMIYRLMAGYTKRGVNSVKRKASPPPTKPYKMTPEIEEAVLSWIKTPPPKGKSKWSAQIIADKIVEEGLVKRISRQTICRLLDKHGIKL